LDEDQVQQLAEWFERRLRSVDQRIDATRTVIDHQSSDTTRQLDALRQVLLRSVLLATTGCALVTALLCLATLILLT
jgi:hypothetical protein